MIGAGSQSLRLKAPRYARSMDSLIELYSGLPGPMGSHTQYKLLERQFESESDPESLYFLPEKSTRWIAHFSKIPDAEKHKELVRRQVGRRLFEARVKGICLYCWFPENENCLCDSFILPHQSSVLPSMKGPYGTQPHSDGSKQRSVNIDVSFILHADELFRQTNTAHVAAIVMDSPLVVWGVLGAEHQDRIAVLGMKSEDSGVERAVTSVGAKSTTRSESVVDVLLYPEVGKSISINDLAATLESKKESDLTIHLHLSDGTWSQARSVNRHVPRTVPRLMLDVDASYEGLFGSLRARTRETGVSTLEATTLAVTQLRQKFAPAAGEGEVVTQAPDVLGDSMRSLMKRYVDFVSLFSTKTGFVPTNLTEEEVDGIVTRRNRYKKFMQRWEEEDREVLGALSVGDGHDGIAVSESDEDVPADSPLPVAAPVCYFCYVCDAFILPLSMRQHCSGRKHVELLKKSGNFSFSPSEASRTMHRPTRSPSELSIPKNTKKST
jgi:DTW domain-containing protein YfiP